MATNTDIPQGYKATALGIIPQEWEIFDFDEIVEKSKERYIPNPDAHLYCIELEHLSQGEGTLIGYTDSAEQKSTKNRFQNGDVLFGKLRPYLQKYWLATFDGVCSTEIWVFHAKPNICLKEYLLRIISSYNFIQKANVSSGSKMPRAEWDYVSKIPVLVPPLAEQRKIAEVLGVWDEAIEKQARLIEKLALRKRALMQRLLSAKLRLPGFSEPWKKVNYSDILKEVRRTLTWDENELYDLISVRRRSGGVFHRESLYGHEIKTKTLRPALEGDFLISKMQIVHGASGVVPKQLSGMKISGSYIALIAKDPKELNINYFNLWSQMPLFYHQTFVSSYGVHIEKMTFDLDAFMSLSMNLPPIEEQNKIVEVISTATNEIELAKEKLERLRRQKRGLMQQLLTGKKRVKY